MRGAAANDARLHGSGSHAWLLTVDCPILGLEDECTAVLTAIDVIRDVVNEAGAGLWSDPEDFNV